MPDPFFRPMPQPAPDLAGDPWKSAPPPGPPMPPLSTSGTDLAPPVLRPRVLPAHDSVSARRLRALEARVAALEAAKDAPPPGSLAWWASRLRLSGFVQPQFVAQLFDAAGSPNADPTTGALPDGVGANDTLGLASGETTNAVFFRMRRARLRLDADLASWRPSGYPLVRLVVELEPLPRTRGVPESGTILRQTEAQLGLPWVCAGKGACALDTLVAAGVMRVPFGFELLEAETARPFVERSFGAESMFPGELDLGVRADTHAFAGRVGVTLALVNGRTLGEQQGSALPDLNRGKDGVLRVRWDAGSFGAGLSGYAGSGQRVDPAGLRFKTFPRWAAGADVELHHVFHEALGQTRAIVEGALASNMDRGLVYPFALPDFPADIKADADAKPEASFSARLEQDTTRWLTWALRFDVYSPDTRLPDDVRMTGSLAAVVHVTRQLRFVAEYDHARDTIRADGDAPKPIRHVSRLSGMMEARF